MENDDVLHREIYGAELPGANLMFVEVAEILTSTQFTWGFCASIGALFLFFGVRFWLPIAALRRAIDKACETFEPIEATDFREQFEEIDSKISEIKKLQQPWGHYVKTFLFRAETQGDILRTTTSASAYFNDEDLIPTVLNTRFLSAAPNILTGLGILGTFLGLAAGIHLASVGLDGDGEALRRSLFDLLGGASMAFWTSVAGVSTSLILTTIERRRLKTTGKKINDLADKLDSLVLIVSPESIAAEQLDIAKEQAAELKKFNSNLAVSIADALDEKIGARLGPSVDRLIEAVEGLRSDRGETNERLLTNLIGEFRNSLSGAAGAEMSAMAQTLGRLDQVLGQSVKSMEEGQTRFSEFSERLGDQFGSMMKEMEVAVNKQLGQISSTFQATVEESSSTLAGQLIEAGNSLTGNVLEAAGRLNSSVERVESTMELWRQLIENSTSLIDRTTQLSNRLDNAHGRFERNARIIADAASKIEDTVQGLTASVNSMGSLSERMHEGANLIIGAQEMNKQAWQAYQERFEKTDQELANTFSQLDEGLHRYAETARKFMLELDTEFAKVSIDLKGILENLESHLSELPDSLRQLEKQVDRLVGGKAA